MKKIIIGAIVVFIIGYLFGRSGEKIVYRTETEYVIDTNSVPKSTLTAEVTKAKKDGYDYGYTEGRKTGRDEGYKSGYTQGTEYGKSLILDQIDLRVKEGEKKDKVVPLFKVKQ
ncbi:MAG: hypothetical protein LBB89_03940 [Treponema sp.]|jgi:flagellar biosynthesis/type III secretory pathway protein FliH|nr:hypothetical protein [Treponema sp.]